MRRWPILLLLSSFSIAQAPQTARQALIEMIKSPTPAQVDRHLPAVMLNELAKLPPDAQRIRQQQTMLLAMGLAMMNVQTFDSGPVFLVIQSPKDATKIELTVERDELTGDTDAMEFGIRTYKQGKPQDLPVPLRILATMRMEGDTWRLVRVGGSVMLALDDPKFAEELVKQVQEELRKQKALQPANGTPVNRPPDTRVIGSLKTLFAAETTYAKTYPNAGFTCQLADLGGSMSGKGADEHAAQLIDPALAAGRKNGYKFEIAVCNAAPSSIFQIVATPLEKNIGWPAYCTDQSGVIRSIAEANASYCIEAGSPVREH